MVICYSLLRLFWGVWNGYFVTIGACVPIDQTAMRGLMVSHISYFLYVWRDLVFLSQSVFSHYIIMLFQCIVCRYASCVLCRVQFIWSYFVAQLTVELIQLLLVVYIATKMRERVQCSELNWNVLIHVYIRMSSWLWKESATSFICGRIPYKFSQQQEREIYQLYSIIAKQVSCWYTINKSIVILSTEFSRYHAMQSVATWKAETGEG